jgi:FkbM family methyltransferase
MKINQPGLPEIEELKNYVNLITNQTIIIPKNIVEIGGATGDDSNYFAEIFNISPNNVFIIEPHPEEQKNIAHNYPQYNLIRCAIFNENKNVKFNCSVAAGTSSVLDRYDNFYHENYTEIIDVSAFTGKKIMEDYNIEEIDICQIDVEGAAYEALKSFKESIKKIKSIHIECEHRQIWQNQKLYADVKKLLEENDFKQLYFRFINNIVSQSESIWINKKFLK